MVKRWALPCPWRAVLRGLCVPGQRRVLLHAGEQVTGGAVRPRRLKQRQVGVAEQVAGAALVELLELEPGFGEQQHPGEDHREDHPVGLVALLHVALERVADRLGVARTPGGDRPVQAEPAGVHEPFVDRVPLHGAGLAGAENAAH